MEQLKVTSPSTVLTPHQSLLSSFSVLENSQGATGGGQGDLQAGGVCCCGARETESQGTPRSVAAMGNAVTIATL